MCFMEYFSCGGCLVREENRILILYKNVKITKRIKKNQGLKSVCNKWYFKWK